VALCTAGIVLAYVVGNLNDGNALVDRALALDPYLAWAWVFGSWTKIWQGDANTALERALRAERLSPDDPEVLFFIETATAYCHFLAGRYEDALSSAQTALRQRPNVVISLSVAAVAAALANRQGEAQQALTRLRELDPALRLADLPDLFPFGRAEDRLRWATALRSAGLPE
jgi:tetratricopeptide (TPR) repeat protein